MRRTLLLIASLLLSASTSFADPAPVPAAGPAPRVDTQSTATENTLLRIRRLGIDIETNSDRSRSWTEFEAAAFLEIAARLPRNFRSFRRQFRLIRDDTPRTASPGMDLSGDFVRGPGSYAITIFTSVYRRWLATLPRGYQVALQRRMIHELAHAFDDNQLLSRSDAWKRISGWQEHNFLFFRYMTGLDNQEARGFARDFGMTSPEEDFATFAEEFFMPTPHRDAEQSIKCRAPTKYQYFANLFPQFDNGLGSVTCAPLASWIDPNQVEDFELLYAAPSTIHPASIAGHLLMRVRMKRPVGARGENPNDPVISFGADIPAAEASAGSMASGGLTGRFRSKLLEERLGDTVIRYNNLENRDLMRFRLRLSDAEKEKVLRRFFEIRKNFRYKYMFLTENCATMLVDQLGVALGDATWSNVPIPMVTPSMLVARLVQAQRAVEVSPSFYSLARRAALAEGHAHRLLDALSHAHATLSWPEWRNLISDQGATRMASYAALTQIAQHNPRLVEDIYAILLFSMEGERAREFRLGQGSTVASESHQALRLRLIEMRRNHALQNGRAAVVSARTDLSRLHRDQELVDRQLGTAHTGVLPFMVTAGYTIASWQGHYEIGIHSSFYRQSMGDQSRFALLRSMEIDILPSVLVISIDQPSLSRWRSGLLTMRQLPEQLDRVRSVFQGGGLGFGVRALEFSGDRWRNHALDARWLTGEVIASIASSAGFTNYLNFSLGLELGTVWLNDNSRGEDRSWLGAPVGLQAQWTPGRNRGTALLLTGSVTPRVTTEANFEAELRASLSLLQRLGDVGGLELNFYSNVEYEDLISIDESRVPTFRFMLGVQGRGY